MLFSDVRQVVGEFARGSVRIDDEGVSLGGVDRVVDGVGCSLTDISYMMLLKYKLDNLIRKMYNMTTKYLNSAQKSDQNNV